MPALLGRLWQRMSARRRRQYVLLLALMIVASFAELISIGSVLPFLTALMQPRLVFDSPLAKPILDLTGLGSESGLILGLTAMFVGATTFACAVRVGLLWCSTQLSFAFGSDLSNSLYRSTLSQPYAVHISRNSGEVVNTIWVKVSEVIFYILLPLMSLVISSIVAVVICTGLAFAVPGTALVALGLLVLVYGVIVATSRRRLRTNSIRIARGSDNVVKTLQEGLGGIRDILIDGSQENFCATYRDVNEALRKAQGQNQIINQGPRYLLEAMGMLLIATLAYLLTMRAGGVATAIPLLAAMALGLQRLLPAAQLMFGSWSTIHGAQASLQDVLDMLELPVPQHDDTRREAMPVSFQRDIALRGVSFRHKADGPWLFDRIDLVIAKGARVGFVGVTGSGKSTLLDLVMGLLDPVCGQIEIDGIEIDVRNRASWQRHIAHVPQSVFLADCSVEENIAFGVPRAQIDRGRVKRAASQAQLADVVEKWPLAYETPVGERGVQLSGGQRQRIGIARALYKKADVIVFDEATSALDSDTERSVMSAIDGLSGNITVLIIAHRLNTLNICTDIVEVWDGTLTRRDSLLSLSGEAIR